MAERSARRAARFRPADAADGRARLGPDGAM